MKKIVTMLLAVLLTAQMFAQSPHKMSYQAIVRDAGNMLIMNSPVSMKISILQGSVSGAVVYTETQNVTTNVNGLVSIDIGSGVGFDTIQWANGPYFIKTETDPTGGTNYSISGTSQLLSVPYALYAASGGSPGPQGPSGPQGVQGLQGQPGTSSCGTINSGDGRIVVYNATNAWGYGFNETSGSFFYSTNLSGTLLGAIASDSNIVIYTTTHAYGFGMNSTSGSGWYMRTMVAPPIGYVITSGRIVLYNASEAYGFGRNNTSGSGWYLRALSGIPLGSFAAGSRIVLYNATDAYGFGYNETSGSDWKLQPLSSPPLDIIGTR